ncbi:hypothetical protein ABFS82_13G057300 [Erythranthe guttata]|nr:PREDICTED: aspartic proteinase CDR1-like [Erythranthe guttata]|eukprot:XP_012847301.1 PREDICTED: aspartic proteinase CDR1-like [Erythranthe guttata]
MAKTINLVIICLFFNLLSLVIISSGLRLKLTHRDSPNSPLYQPNLSDFERFNKNIEISKARASNFFHQFKPQNVSLRAPLTYHEPIYTVDIGLGTPAVKRTFIFDTGSHLTWTQCKPCIKCFRQKQPLFDVKKSVSYKLMPRTNKLSKGFECSHIGCVYGVKYYSGQFSTGVLSLEDFTFGTSAGVPRRILNMVFGCGMNNHGSFGEKNVASGILGMDKEPISFARQLGARIKNRFSYCLTNIDSGKIKESYLRFGEEAVIKGKNTRSTPFLRSTPHAHYMLKLTDISISGRKLGLTQGTFPEGCLIDSGSAIGLLNEKAFLKVEKFLTVYFSRFKNVRRVVGKQVPKGLICYMNVVPTGSFFAKLPNMTYHFEGADFDVPWENTFVVFAKGMFCFAAMKSQNATILGAHQQRNVRVVYELRDDKLSFAPEDCSRDAI